MIRRLMTTAPHIVGYRKKNSATAEQSTRSATSSGTRWWCSDYPATFCDFPATHGEFLGNTVGFPGNILGFSCNILGFPGNTVGFPGNVRRFLGNTVGFPGNTVGFPGNIQGFPGNTVGFPGNILGFPGNTVGFLGNTVGFPGNIQGFPGNTVGFPGNIQRFPGNILSAIVWLRRRVVGNNSSAVYLAALAINDLAYLLLDLVNFHGLKCSESDGWTCYCHVFVAASTVMLEPLLVLGFSVERLIVMLRPLKVRLTRFTFGVFFARDSEEVGC